MPIFSLLVFPDAAMPCRDFRSDDGCTRLDCLLIHDEDSSLLAFIELLDNAQTSMDICVSNAITCEEVRLAWMCTMYERLCGSWCCKTDAWTVFVS